MAKRLEKARKSTYLWKLFIRMCVYIFVFQHPNEACYYSHESALFPISTVYSFIHGNGLLVTNNSICFQCNRFLDMYKIYHGLFFIDFCFVLFKYYVFLCNHSYAYILKNWVNFIFWMTVLTFCLMKKFKQFHGIFDIKIEQKTPNYYLSMLVFRIYF